MGYNPFVWVKISGLLRYSIQFCSDMVLCLSFNYSSNKNVYIIFPTFKNSPVSIDQPIPLAAWPTTISLNPLRS